MIIVLGTKCKRLEWAGVVQLYSEHVTISDVSEATRGYWGHVKDTEGSLSIDFHISNAKSLELSKELTSWTKGC